MENNRFEKSNTCLSPIDEVIKKRFDEKGKLIERRTREETVEYVGGEGVRIRGAHYRSVHKTFSDWKYDWQMEENVTITKPSGKRIEIYVQGDNGMNCLIYHCKETFLWGGTFDGHKVDCVKTWIVINGPLETRWIIIGVKFGVPSRNALSVMAVSILKYVLGERIMVE